MRFDNLNLRAHCKGTISGLTYAPRITQKALVLWLGLVLVQHNNMYQKNRDAHHALLSVFRERFHERSGPEFAVSELLTGTKQRGGESTAAFERPVVQVGRASPGLVTDKLLLHIFCANVTVNTESIARQKP